MDIVFPSIRLPLPIVPCLCPSVHVCIPLRPPRPSSLRAFLRVVPPSHFTVYRGLPLYPALFSPSLHLNLPLPISFLSPFWLSSYCVFHTRLGVSNQASSSHRRILPEQQHHHQGALASSPPYDGGDHPALLYHFPPLFAFSSFLYRSVGHRPCQKPWRSSRLLLRTLKLVRLLLGSRGTKTEQKETKRQPEPSRERQVGVGSSTT